MSPSPLRCLIVGTSGCGKTTLLYNLIIKNWGIPFQYSYIYFKIFTTAHISRIKKGI
jgi:ABC-type lipoprotein export system ATPase subunit